MMAVGIFDWGIGGLRLFRALRDERPDLDLIYLNDCQSEMYSLQSREALAERVEQVCQYFARIGVEQVIAASDSASTVLGDFSVPHLAVSGLIEPTLRMMPRVQAKEIGIIGGKRTIVSGLYGRALRKMRFMVVQRVSEGLTQQVEAGRLHDPQTKEIVQAMLEPLTKSDAILLANTHFGFVKPLIKAAVPNTSIIDPVKLACLELTESLPHSHLNRGTTMLLTTGDPNEMKRKVAKMFDWSVEVRAANLSEPKLAA